MTDFGCDTQFLSYSRGGRRYATLRAHCHKQADDYSIVNPATDAYRLTRGQRHGVGVLSREWGVTSHSHWPAPPFSDHRPRPKCLHRYNKGVGNGMGRGWVAKSPAELLIQLILQTLDTFYQTPLLEPHPPSRPLIVLCTVLAITILCNVYHLPLPHSLPLGITATYLVHKHYYHSFAVPSTLTTRRHC